MKIGELATKSGVTRDTVRLYESKGMLVGITRPFEYNTYKDYPEENLKRMDMILAMKRLGFTLAEIKEAMDVLFSDGDKETFKTEFLERKIASLDAKIAELVELRDHLKHFFDAECDREH